MTPQMMFSDALERVQLDPAVASLPAIELARRAAELMLAEAAPNVAPLPDFDRERYTAGLAYVAEGNLKPVRSGRLCEQLILKQ